MSDAFTEFVELYEELWPSSRTKRTKLRAIWEGWMYCIPRDVRNEGFRKFAADYPDETTPTWKLLRSIMHEMVTGEKACAESEPARLLRVWRAAIDRYAWAKERGGADNLPDREVWEYMLRASRTQHCPDDRSAHIETWYEILGWEQMYREVGEDVPCWIEDVRRDYGPEPEWRARKRESAYSKAV